MDPDHRVIKGGDCNESSNWNITVTETSEQNIRIANISILY